MKFFPRVLAIVLLMLVAVVTISRRDDSGAWIAYASVGDNGGTIHLMTSDGHNVRKLASNDLCASAPRWFSSIIIFESHCGNTEGYFMHVLPGTSRPAVFYAERPFTYNLELSPNGEQIMMEWGRLFISVADADFSSERQLSNNHFGAEWSPDGEWIYAHVYLNASSVDRIHVATGRIESVIEARSGHSDLGWSPDAAEIAVGGQTEAGIELIVMTPNGDRLRSLISDPPFTHVFETQWSPDGAWIAFLAAEPGYGTYVYRVRPDGRDFERLTISPGIVDYLQWTPDSEWLVFAANFYRTQDIYRLRPDGLLLQNLTDSPEREFSPDIAPFSDGEWHPLWLMTAAIGIIFLSMIGRLRR
jgi:hypothetical protein